MDLSRMAENRGLQTNQPTLNESIGSVDWITNLNKIDMINASNISN